MSSRQAAFILRRTQASAETSSLFGLAVRTVAVRGEGGTSQEDRSVQGQAKGSRRQQRREAATMLTRTTQSAT